MSSKLDIRRAARYLPECKASLTTGYRLKVRVNNTVREHRLRAGKTQQDLAAACGVSRQSIISIERGRYVPSLPLGLRLARIFSCSTDELFELVEDGK